MSEASEADKAFAEKVEARNAASLAEAAAAGNVEKQASIDRNLNSPGRQAMLEREAKSREILAKDEANKQAMHLAHDAALKAAAEWSQAERERIERERTATEAKYTAVQAAAAIKRVADHKKALADDLARAAAHKLHPPPPHKNMWEHAADRQNVLTDAAAELAKAQAAVELNVTDTRTWQDVAAAHEQYKREIAELQRQHAAKLAKGE